MDFSHYGEATPEWTRFIGENPDALREGFEGNEISNASFLRAAVDGARSKASVQLLSESGLDKKVTFQTIKIPSKGSHEIPIRVCRPRDGAQAKSNKTLLFFHGGGLLFGDETTDDIVMANMVAGTGAVVLNPIYRHTNTHSHPAQTDDAWDAFEYICSNGESLQVSTPQGIGLIGVSAGALLAAGVVLRHLEKNRSEGTRPMINGVVLSIPWLIHFDNYPFHLFASREVTSMVQCADRPVIPLERVKLMNALLNGSPTDRVLNPGLAPEAELKGWPKTWFLIAGGDPLRDDGLLFASRLRDMGVRARVNIYTGLPHGFRRWSSLSGSKVFDVDTMQALNWALAEETGAEASEGEREWSEYVGK
ncbi:Alpha/Beta hydrolase protein [Emericellopsis atlantica]|uniref:Alpha/Beta hydrolase protein n=1 Tax=Emericellopsis atlantica TaxID=2614577 RepID=A0A9P7ZH09_9HYPO|nr:Alpha/Beta hydrolase protein [Emericellopsis atlantica]KAG9251993.1 Alpha/Beta hydrolase protein [Emericellopsis atlantica]